MQTFLHGFVVCFGLIVSIGAQNAYLLKQGILKQHVFWTATLCFVCDVALMTLGVLGLGSVIAHSLWLSLILALCGALFLFSYGSRAFLAAYRASGFLEAQGNSQTSLKKAVMITLAITLLNPHVYIDTVVIIGSIGSTLTFEEKILFLIGALSCSFIWFYGLGYGAALLRRYFEKRRTWQILDSLTGMIMYLIAGSLIIYAWGILLKLLQN